MPGVDRIIAVASGKGGVGKSTVACNLATALASAGFSVGLLDADIYGPSIGLMMGVPVAQRPDVENNLLTPITAHGVACMSMSFVTSAKTPAVWRGPMASGALQQLLTQTRWPELDYLIVDMPPGTGDIQLTMAQRVPIHGAVIVTTPQDIALLDARKGIEMFCKVAVPVIGVVENMSYHVCGECGHREALFGEGGGERIAAEYETPVLARLPLSASVQRGGDGGLPHVLAEPDSEGAAQLRSLATEVHQRSEALVTTGPSISIVDD